MDKSLMTQARSGYGEYQESKQLSEIKGKMYLARQFPRDEERSLARVLNECSRRELAEQAQYEFPRGDSTVRGPSIRLVEVLARHWGNLTFGVQDLEDNGDETLVKAYAWDLETNVSDEKTFTAKHERTTKTKVYKLKDSRDVYEAVSNLAARRKRACILAVLPGWYVDAAVEACDKTLQEALTGGGKSLQEVVSSMLEAFGEYGITPAHIEEKIGKEIGKLNNNDVVKLRRLYASINDGFVKPADAFNLGGESAEEKAAPTGEKESAALDAINQRIGGKANAAPAPAPADIPTHPAEDEEGQGKLPWD